MQNPPLVMPPLAPEVVLLRILLETEIPPGRELRAQLDQLPDPRRSGFDNRAHRADVAESGARNQRILDMLVERIQFIDHAGNPSLGEPAVALVNLPFRQYRDAPAGFRQVQRAGKSGKSAADHQMIKLQNFTDFHENTSRFS